MTTVLTGLDLGEARSAGNRLVFQPVGSENPLPEIKKEWLRKSWQRIVEANLDGLFEDVRSHLEISKSREELSQVHPDLSNLSSFRVFILFNHVSQGRYRALLQLRALFRMLCNQLAQLHLQSLA